MTPLRPEPSLLPRYMRISQYAVKCRVQSPQDTTGLKGERHRRQSHTRLRSAYNVCTHIFWLALNEI